jgi:hypothetical protein
VQNQPDRINQIKENMGLEPVKTIVEAPVAILMLVKFGKNIAIKFKTFF